MIYQKKTINNVPTKVPLSNSAPVGNPIGTIISTYKKIQPRNYLYCDGSTFDENVYPALYLYLGTNVLPDYRECAMVGAEKNTTDVFDSTETDPSTGLPGTQNHDVYSQGEFKDDQIQSHKHQFGNGALSLKNSTGWSSNGAYGGSGTILETMTVEGPTNSRTGSVTRGKRKAVYYYIKAVAGVDISDEDTFLNTVKDYVDSKNSYSTDEIPTGGTWIDGKPIYRKVIPFDKTLGYTGVHPTVEIGTIPQNGVLTKIDYYGYTATYNIKVYNNNSLNVIVQGQSIRASQGFANSQIQITGFVIIEYTKTTD